MRTQTRKVNVERRVDWLLTISGYFASFTYNLAAIGDATRIHVSTPKRKYV